MTDSGTLSLAFVALIVLVANTRGFSALLLSSALIAISLAGASLWNTLAAPPWHFAASAQLCFAILLTLPLALKPIRERLCAPWIMPPLTWIFLELAALQSRQTLPELTHYLRDGTWQYLAIACALFISQTILRRFGSGGGT